MRIIECPLWIGNRLAPPNLCSTCQSTSRLPMTFGFVAAANLEEFCIGHGEYYSTCLYAFSARYKYTEYYILSITYRGLSTDQKWLSILITRMILPSN